VLARLSLHLRRERTVRSALATALLYPALVLLVAVVSMLLVSLVVLPRMRGLMPESAGAPSALAVNLFLMACALLAGVAGAAAAARRRFPSIARRVDRLIIALPFAGGAVLSGQLERFCFAMATLTGSGMGVVEAIEESARAVSNLSLREALFRCAADARRGRRLSAAFLGQTILPERLSRWIAVGERTGRVEQVFAELTAYYDAEVELATKRVTTLAEPAIILAVGVGVIFLLCTFFLPLLSALSGMV
jgi:general secretion pathway protein F